jgi:hypothetical protein
MIYEIATLSIKLGTAAKAIAGIGDYVKAPGAKGTLLGCWSTEISDLNQLLVLRGFDDHAQLLGERERILRTTDPFGAGDAIAGLNFDSYAPFPFLPPVKPGKYGAVYEIRTYKLKHGGVPHTIAAWEAAIPARWTAAFHAHLALCQPGCTCGGARRFRREGYLAAKGRA